MHKRFRKFWCSAIVPIALYQVLIGPHRSYCVDNMDVFHTLSVINVSTILSGLNDFILVTSIGWNSLI